MADTNNIVTLTLGYANTDFTRKITFGGLSADVLTAVKANILAVNSSLEGGTADGLDTFFLSDTGDNFTGIVAAQYETVETTDISLTEVNNNG